MSPFFHYGRMRLLTMAYASSPACMGNDRSPGYFRPGGSPPLLGFPRRQYSKPAGTSQAQHSQAVSDPPLCSSRSPLAPCRLAARQELASTPCLYCTHKEYSGILVQYEPQQYLFGLVPQQQYCMFTILANVQDACKDVRCCIQVTELLFQS